MCIILIYLWLCRIVFPYHSILNVAYAVIWIITFLYVFLLICPSCPASRTVLKGLLYICIFFFYYKRMVVVKSAYYIEDIIKKVRDTGQGGHIGN